MKKLIGYDLVGIEAEVLHTNIHGQTLTLHSSIPTVYFENPSTNHYYSLTFEWYESDDGDDWLTVQENEEEGDIMFNYSSFLVHDRVQNVLEYGENGKLSTFVIELEENYIQIIAHPAYEIKVLSEMPNIRNEKLL